MENLEASIDISAPLELCYQWWRDFLAYPSFIHNVQSVTQISEKVWRYGLVGQEGDVSQWDLELDQDIPNRLISWRSLAGPELDIWIDSSFIQLASNETHATLAVALSYPKNPVGTILKKLYGVNIETLTKNLQSFKAVIEADFKGKKVFQNCGQPASEKT